MPRKTIDWEQLKNDFILDKEHLNARTWLREVKKWTEAQLDSGNTQKHIDSWSRDKADQRQILHQKKIEEMERAELEMIPFLMASEITIVNGAIEATKEMEIEIVTRETTKEKLPDGTEKSHSVPVIVKKKVKPSMSARKDAFEMVRTKLGRTTRVIKQETVAEASQELKDYGEKLKEITEIMQNGNIQREQSNRSRDRARKEIPTSLQDK